MESVMEGGGDDAEAPRTADEKRRARRRGDRRECRLAVVVTVQSVVVALCFAVTLYVYWGRDEVYIEFDTIGDVADNETLEFYDYRGKNIGLADKSVIFFNCTGTYGLHMDVCYKGFEYEGKGFMELRVSGHETPLSNFTLHAKSDVCRRLHSTVYLRRKERATLHFSSPGTDLKITNVTLGLNYLLGRHSCDS